MADSPLSALSNRYIRFAAEEVAGRSPLYERLARGVAADRDVLDFLMTLPEAKRQPNLLLASFRHLFGVPADWSACRTMLLANTAAIRSVMLTRSTQTNEPARCATLLPVLARLPQPLALIEVGASAGLCLLPDFYGYDYVSGDPVTGAEPRRVRPAAATGRYPIFTCAASRGTPLPDIMPRVVWRAGLDLHPLDAADPAQAAWLQTLVWPEQTGRRANLLAALEIGAAQHPRIVQGDLLGDGLARLCREAPAGATKVVLHSAVLAYVTPQAARDTFAARVGTICDYWICNESPRAFPGIANRASSAGAAGQFLLSVDGDPVAWTDPHGAAIDWIASHGWMPERCAARGT